MYENFSKLLQKHSVTPYKVSKETGVSQSTLSDWKRGISTPKPDKLQKIADYFDVPLTYFLTETTEVPAKGKTPKLTSKNERDIEKALKETIVRVKQNSIEYHLKNMAPTDMAALQRSVADKKALEELEKVHISID